ncbi:MAG: hypothetical protein R6W90_16415 [Ignavibacteriaceae bacterium]
MTEQHREFVNVCLYDLVCPITVGTKSKAAGESTLINIMVEAEIERKYEQDFGKNILEIVNNRDTYIGPMQLSTKIIAYINSINAGNFTIVFRYPVFLEKHRRGSASKYLAKYNCERIIKRTSLITYKKLFVVEIPVILEKHASGSTNNSPDVNNKILVKAEGFEPIFAEDIIEIVEDVTDNRIYEPQTAEGENIRLKLSDEIKKRILDRLSCDNCTVKIISEKIQYSYSSVVTGKNEKKEEDKKYSEEYSII